MLGLNFAAGEYSKLSSTDAMLSRQPVHCCLYRKTTCAALPSKATVHAAPAETEFVAVDNEKKPSLAVLSLGCGTTSKLSDVKKFAGKWGWAAKGVFNRPCISRTSGCTCDDPVM